jgi:hypothetical protein
MMTGVRLADTVAIVEDEHGAVLLNTRDTTMFGLNPAAAAFATALDAGLEREAATQVVIDAFDADEQTIRADLDALVGELTAHGLIQEAP